MGETASVTNRDARGLFLPGNNLSRGDPLAAILGKKRKIVITALSDRKLKAIMTALIKEAEKGNVQAAALIFDRVFGKPVQPTADVGAGAVGLPDTLKNLPPAIWKLIEAEVLNSLKGAVGEVLPEDGPPSTP